MRILRVARTAYFVTIFVTRFSQSSSLLKPALYTVVTHLRKLKNLVLIISENHNDKAICNDTNIIFTEEELNLLSKGLSYSFFPSSINFKKVQAEFESLFSQIVPCVNSNNNLLRLKCCFAKCYDTFISSFMFDKKSDRYFSADIHNTIKCIKDKTEKNGLITVKADKGNTVVIMFKQKYDEKMMLIPSIKVKIVLYNSVQQCWHSRYR